jgi:hypothetical protein
MTPDATALEQLAALLASFLAPPTTEALQAAFVAGFSTPIALFLVAYGIGLLIHFWR